MSDSTPNLTQMSAATAARDVVFNSMVDALSPSANFGRDGLNCSALTWAVFGTPRLYINAAATVKANFTLSLTASSTRYVMVDRSFAGTEIGTAFDPAKLALYKVVTGASAVSGHEDHRDPHHLNRFLYGRVTLAMADANQTLSYAQAMCESMELTGALTALRDVIVPAVPRDWKIFANTTGGFGVRVKTSAGTGVTIADGKRAIVECDGTNVVRVTPDT